MAMARTHAWNDHPLQGLKPRTPNPKWPAALGCCTPAAPQDPFVLRQLPRASGGDPGPSLQLEVPSLLGLTLVVTLLDALGQVADGGRRRRVHAPCIRGVCMHRDSSMHACLRACMPMR